MLTKSLVRVSLAAVVTTMFIGCGGGEDPAAPENTSSSSETIFLLSAIPDEKITDQEAKFGKLAEYLEGKLGVKTQFMFSKDYADAVTKFANGEEASQYLITEHSICTVPWDDAGAYLRFSVTYVAEDEAAEDALMAETKARLETIRPVF